MTYGWVLRLLLEPYLSPAKVSPLRLGQQDSWASVEVRVNGVVYRELA